MLETKIKISKYSHGFSVRPYNRASRDAVLSYCKKYIEWTYVKSPPDWVTQRVAARVYGAATKDRSDFRFHINTYSDFVLHMGYNGFSEKHFDVTELPLPDYLEVEHKFTADITPYEIQREIIDFFKLDDRPIRVTNLQPGGGKTLIFLYTMMELGRRTLLQLRGGYVSRWLQDIEGYFDYDKEDVLVVRGTKHLLGLIDMAKADLLTAKVIIITHQTMHTLLKEYELEGDENGFGINPEELCSLLQVGLKGIDEVHENYHLNFRSDIYTNVAKSVHLSATLETEDKFKQMLYDITYPRDTWFKGNVYDSYCVVRAVHFNIADMSKVRTSERGRTDYSHNAFEKSIIKDKVLLNEYLKLIKLIVHESFISSFETGQRCLVFCGMTEMIDIVTKYLREFYHELVISEYYSGIGDEVLRESDIIVSTVESCGTAKDIPNLTSAVLTRALNKLEANEQVKGRLRKIRDWPDLDPVLYYFVCDDVERHVKYHEDKIEQYKGKVASHTDYWTGITLKTK